ncbi:MAG: hypothetical protein H7249_19880 [Chitinophagaceae bacterium]|nr:hypothetical protein [Oligoflexus sp.]
MEKTFAQLTGLSFLVLPLALMGCNSSKGGDTRTVVEGYWVSACLPTDEQGLGTHATAYRLSYTFAPGHVVLRTWRGYSDEACTHAANTILQKGLYALEVIPNVAYFNIDLIFHSVEATPDSDLITAAWNTEGFCGNSTWHTAETLSVLGDTAAPCQSFGVQTIEYRDLVQVNAGRELDLASIYNNDHPRPARMGALGPAHVFSLAVP